MRKFIPVAAVLTTLCLLGGCGSSATNSADATTEAAPTEIIPIEMNAEDYVELGQYKGLTIDGVSTEVTEADIDEEIEAFAEDCAEVTEITDRDTVQDDDMVNISYECVIDGKDNEDYSMDDVDMTIGSGDYVIGDDFDMETGVIGAKVGSTVTLNLKFPSDYDDTDVAGKDCEMKITINSIEKETIPEVTDALVKENTDCSTVEAYREELRTELEDEKESDAESSNQTELWDQIMANATQKKDFPDDLVNDEINNIEVENADIADYYGYEDIDSFLTDVYGMSLEDYANYLLKDQCVTDLIAKEEGIEITDDDYDKEIKNMVDEYGFESEDELYEYYTEDEIRQELLTEKIFDTLMKETTINITEDSTETTEAAG